MAAGPIVGYLLALGLIRWLEIGPPWNTRLKLVGVILGALASGRETVRLIRRLSRPD